MGNPTDMFGPKNITREYLKSILRYDKSTGHFYWKVRNSNRVSINSRAGAKEGCGYICIGIDGHRYKAHRLAFLYMNGYFPVGVDHIDENKSNNCWSNLREASKSENQFNTRVQARARSGYKGVYPAKSGATFYAYTRVGGKKKHIGAFPTAKAAARAYLAFIKELHGSFLSAHTIAAAR
jgi:hypothetical protein